MGFDERIREVRARLRGYADQTLARLRLARYASQLPADAVAVAAGADHWDPLDLIQATQTLRSHTDMVAAQAVVAAREAGKSWSEIGAALGVTKQSAQERFKAAEDYWHRCLMHPITDEPYTVSQLGDIADPERAIADLREWLAAVSVPKEYDDDGDRDAAEAFTAPAPPTPDQRAAEVSWRLGALGPALLEGPLAADLEEDYRIRADARDRAFGIGPYRQDGAGIGADDNPDENKKETRDE